MSRQIPMWRGWLVLSFLAAVPAAASTLRDDVDPNVYVDYGDTFKLVGGVYNGFSAFGSGVVIDRQWVLTAAHVVADATSASDVVFEVDPDPNEIVAPGDIPVSGLFGVDLIAIHEYYDNSPTMGPAGGFDVALLHLDAPIPQYTPWNRARINSAVNPELGHQGTPVGFGATGTGLTGYDALTGGFARIAGDNMMDGLGTDPRVIDEFVARDVTDPITGLPVHFTQAQIASQFLISDFDAPPASGTFANPLGSANPLALEACVAPGDSGGPMFIDFGNGLQVAGLNSWILGLPPPDGDGTDDASYGDLAGYLRVSVFNDWIDEVIGVPEPTGAAVLLLLGAFGLARRRRAA